MSCNPVMRHFRDYSPAGVFTRQAGTRGGRTALAKKSSTL